MTSRLASVLAPVLVTTLLATGVAREDGPTSSSPGSTNPPTTTGTTQGPRMASSSSQAAQDFRLQRRLNGLVKRTGFPGVIASVRGQDGRVREYTAGSGDLETSAPVPVNSRVRIASNTKMFTATVVLQLVAEGAVSLDEPVERYLPGLVRGGGSDGRRITVRQLLQHTSGLPDYDALVAEQGGSLQAVAHTYVEPRDLLDAALNERRLLKAGTDWEYSNTNYIVLGLMVQRVTGRPISEEITRRVIDRVGLRETYWPRQGEQRLRGPHPRGYWSDAPGEPYEDITRMDPSLGWAAGQLVSTTADLGQFMQSLLAGELLPPAEMAQMLTTVPAPGFDVGRGWRYGLGVAQRTLPCGGVAWGHGGDIQGFETRNLATRDGRWAVVAVTALPTSLRMLSDVGAAVDAALC